MNIPRFLFTLSTAAALAAIATAGTTSPASQIPLIGTYGSSLKYLRGTSPYVQIPLVGTDAHGHAYPGATVPFGAVQVSPDTRTGTWDGSSGYHYSDKTILGFSMTHLSGTGVGCLGDVMLMPTVGPLSLEAGTPGNGYSSAFSHLQEYAVPGDYKVFLQTPKVEAEMTASEHCGFLMFTFPRSEDSHIVLDLVHGVGNDADHGLISVDKSSREVDGYRVSNGWGGRRTVYFALKFGTPFKSWGIQANGTKLPAGTQEADAKEARAWFDFSTNAQEQILVKVGISNTSIEAARQNLNAEIPDWDIDKVRQQAEIKWDKVFGQIKVESPDDSVIKTFYANLYLSCLAPTLYNDADGSYWGFDHKVHTKPDFKNYTTFSNWDIYRAEWPLINLIHPDRVADMVKSMMAEYSELGQHTQSIWPLYGNETWCMIGYHGADMIAESYLEGNRGFDAELAYQQMKDMATQNRNGLDTYKSLGYVASKPGFQATSKSLEYAYDDWCIAKMAQALGINAEADYFFKRSASYRNLFDRTTGFFRGRLADGSWRTPFADNALVGDEYTEADAWQYAFDVQQDVPGLIQLFGGDKGFIKKMDDMFAADSYIYTGIPDISGRIGQYSQGDEQSHHVAYLYDYAGAPYKTQKWIRDIMAKEYGPGPDGECGNVDCGQMAAWYVFSALGFYPVNPASGVYAIGSPAVSKATIRLQSGKSFTVSALNNSPTNVYIQSAQLNGKALNKPWITYKEVVNGGVLILRMGPKPNKTWGASKADVPPATLSSSFYGPLPAPAAAGNEMNLSAPIKIACGASQAVDGFVADPTSIFGSSHADASVDVSVANAAPLAVYQTERFGKDIVYTIHASKSDQYLVRLHFAEIFDSGAGERVEDVSINGKTVLKNFDIFKEAGENKAVVKSFSGITANAKGEIVIRIRSTDTSPDQNAKISGIEVLKS